MFTGLVEAAGQVLACRRTQGALEIDLDLGRLARDVREGDSIALDGCCLTVATLDRGVATFHLMGETLEKTWLARLQPDTWVNVERSLRVGDRLGGHFVTGHVDGVGRIAEIVAAPGQTTVWIELPPELFVLCVPKGSICLNGVSLTLIGLESPRVSVGLIPHTLGVTTLGRLRVDDLVNVEADVLGKWVQRLLPKP